MTSTTPAPDGSRLGAGWRVAIPNHVAALARAWTDPSAWEGMTQVGGVSLPGEVAGRIALNETAPLVDRVAAFSGRDPGWTARA